MRKIILLLFAVAILMGCATTYYDSEGNPVPKEQMAVLKAKAVRAHLQDRRYRVFVDRVYPMRGPSYPLRDDWGIEISGDSVGLFLPYFGRVFQVPYGKGLGLNLVSPLDSYEEETIKDGVRVTMRTHSEVESFLIVMEAYNNATVDLTVSPSGREIIRFSGEMQLNDVFRIVQK